MKHLSDQNQKNTRWSPFFFLSLLWVFTEVCGLSPLALQGFLIVVLGLSSSLVTCGSLVSRPEVEPLSPALEGRVSATGPAGKCLR